MKYEGVSRNWRSFLEYMMHRSGNAHFSDVPIEDLAKDWSRETGVELCFRNEVTREGQLVTVIREVGFSLEPGRKAPVLGSLPFSKN